MVAFGLAFKTGAGAVVKQELELDAEPALGTLLQMGAELILVSGQHVQAALKARVVDLAKGHAQESLQRAAGRPAPGPFPFAPLSAKTGPREQAGGPVPTARPRDPAR